MRIKFHYILVLFFLVDIFNKYFPEYCFSLLFKSILLGYLLILTFRRGVVKEFWILGGILFFFMCSHGYMIFIMNVPFYELLTNVRILGLYIFPLVLAFNYRCLLTTANDNQDKTYDYFNVFIVLVIFTTFLGWLFDIDYFKTYSNSRFGYMGVLPKSITASFFYIFSILYLFKKRSYLLLIITLIASFLLGTKSVLLFVGMFLVYVTITKKKYKLASLLLILLFFLRVRILEITKEIWYPFYTLYEKTSFITSLTSYRSDIFLELATMYIERWSFLNYIFGGRFVVNDLFEMALFDSIAFFGVVGGIAYNIIYIQTIKFKVENKLLFFAIFAVLLIASLAGQYFLNSSIVFYSILIFYYISQQKNMKEIHPVNNRVKILNTAIDNFSMTETIDHIDDAITNKNQIHHVVVNAGKIVALQKDLELRKSVNGADVINADGQAVVWAAKFLGKPLKERVAGIDLMENLVAKAHENKYKIFFFGAKEEIVKEVVTIYANKYSSDIIAGYRNGYFDKNEESVIAEQIANSGAHILFVAISSPTKENFLFQNREILSKVNFTMGVGGSFDVVAGLVKRAPVWMQKSGLEWFYRFAQEPKRMWKRYLVGNTKFILLVLKEKFKA